MGRAAETIAPVFLEHRSRDIPEFWFSGIQRFESIEDGVVRALLYSNRLTSDGLKFRDPVISLLCMKGVIAPCAREALFFATGIDGLLQRH